MFRRVILARLSAAEKELGVSLDYARHIARVSLRAFFKFVKIMPLASYRRALPREPDHVARTVATRDEDCGTCVQIEVNLARKDRVPGDVLRVVLDRRPEDLPEELAEVYRFAEEVVTATWQEGVWRERIRQRYGDEALVELALAIAVCRVFPVTKRALGFAISCNQVNIQV